MLPVRASCRLLLISPTGYGNTTLMEYVASRLGLVFVEVNGLAVGHAVTSIAPSEAPNATARQEVERINPALEMGTNVMLYLDDIQPTSLVVPGFESAPGRCDVARPRREHLCRDGGLGEAITSLEVVSLGAYSGSPHIWRAR